jgi:F5/8 type C domain
MENLSPLISEQAKNAPNSRRKYFYGFVVTVAASLAIAAVCGKSEGLGKSLGFIELQEKSLELGQDTELRVSLPSDTFPGVASGVLSLSASSSYYVYCGADRARLDYTVNSDAGCLSWAASSTTMSEYLQLSSAIPHQFKAIVTLGRADYNQWVSSYVLEYTSNGVNWHVYNNSEIIIANNDRKTPAVKHLAPFTALAIRIRPLTWNGYISMRAEAYVSDVEREFDYHNAVPTIGLGLPLSVSSFYNEDSAEQKLKLDLTGYGTLAWVAKLNNINQWAQVSTGVSKSWTKLDIKGRADTDNWVTEFYLSYSNDGLNWNLYNHGEILKGSEDRNTIITKKLSPFTAKSVRIHPFNWKGWISMKAELYAVDVEDETSPLTAALSLGLPVQVSSYANSKTKSHYLRLNSESAWSPASGSKNPWVLVSSIVNKLWTKIEVQGRPDKNEWVTEFTLTYTSDGKNWFKYNDGAVLKANSDKNTIVSVSLTPFYARSIKVYPVRYYGNPSMRLEAYFSS